MDGSKVFYLVTLSPFSWLQRSFLSKTISQISDVIWIGLGPTAFIGQWNTSICPNCPTGYTFLLLHYFLEFSAVKRNFYQDFNFVRHTDCIHEIGCFCQSTFVYLVFLLKTVKLREQKKLLKGSTFITLGLCCNS